jgi:hypothetical protein
VPTIALPKPPPTVIAAGGSSVIAAKPNVALPRIINRYSTEKSGKSAAMVAAPVSKLMTALNTWRG